MVGPKCEARGVNRVVEIHQRCIDGSCALLLGFDQLFEMCLEFLILTAGLLNERRTILRVLFQGCIK